MTRTRYFILLLTGLCLLSVSSAASPPNVLFLFSDDQRHDTIAVYQPAPLTFDFSTVKKPKNVKPIE